MNPMSIAALAATTAAAVLFACGSTDEHDHLSGCTVENVQALADSCHQEVAGNLARECLFALKDKADSTSRLADDFHAAWPQESVKACKLWGMDEKMACWAQNGMCTSVVDAGDPRTAAAARAAAFDELREKCPSVNFSVPAPGSSDDDACRDSCQQTFESCVASGAGANMDECLAHGDPCAAAFIACERACP